MDLGRDVAMMEQAGAQWAHIDVMDGHFVPNLTFGVPLVKQLARITDLPLDVHLMISNPLTQIPWFVEAGATSVTVHVEACGPGELEQAVAMLRDAGVMAAAAIKPKTPVSALAPVLADLDMVLVMSVEPGFSGQSYIASSEVKVAHVVEMAGKPVAEPHVIVSSIVQMAREAGASPLIQVDGGIGVETAALVAAHGADVLVCGNAVFAATDPAAAISAIESAGDGARRSAMSL